MRMNLHTLSKLGFILTFAVFLVLFMLTVVIGIVGTDQTKLSCLFLTKVEEILAGIWPSKNTPLLDYLPLRSFKDQCINSLLHLY